MHKSKYLNRHAHTQKKNSTLNYVIRLAFKSLTVFFSPAGLDKLQNIWYLTTRNYAFYSTGSDFLCTWVGGVLTHTTPPPPPAPSLCDQMTLTLWRGVNGGGWVWGLGEGMGGGGSSGEHRPLCSGSGKGLVMRTGSAVRWGSATQFRSQVHVI